jgi:cytochrome c biogenesis protein ResB
MSTTTLLLRTGTAELLRLRTVRSTWWFLAAYALFMVGLGAALGLRRPQTRSSCRASRPG